MRLGHRQPPGHRPCNRRRQPATAASAVAGLPRRARRPPRPLAAQPHWCCRGAASCPAGRPRAEPPGAVIAAPSISVPGVPPRPATQAGRACQAGRAGCPGATSGPVRALSATAHAGPWPLPSRSRPGTGLPGQPRDGTGYAPDLCRHRQPVQPVAGYVVCSQSPVTV